MVSASPDKVGGSTRRHTRYFMAFKKGDHVTGIPGHYGITNHLSLCRVLNTDGDSLYVEVVDHDDPTSIGYTFWVVSDKFVLVEPHVWKFIRQVKNV